MTDPNVSGALATARWFSCPNPRPQASLRLFCFPYAGGGAAIYRTWTERLPQAVEVHALQLPGRGIRMMERPFNRMPPLISAIAQAMLPHLDKPFAFFGHSMGALTCFELARHMRRKGEPLPLHLFLSGARAPQIIRRSTPIHALPRTEFIKKLRRLNGTPKELLECGELMRLMLPTLRADIKICETYVYRRELPFNLPISVFGGLQDRRVSQSQLEAWRHQTNDGFSLEMLPGDHFFLHSAESPLLPLLSRELRRIAKQVV